MIPNVYRFVFGLRPQTEPFHLLHYICLVSCLEVNRPEKVVVHCQNEPWGPLWERVRPRIEVEPIVAEKRDAVLHYDDPFMAQYAYAHLADFVRLRVLLEYGGVYADMDTLFVAPPPAEFFEALCVMGRERVDVAASSRPEGSLCNAYIMAAPGAEFVRIWLERMPAAFDGSWSNHSTFLPYRLSQEFPDLIRVEPESRFFWLDWSQDGIADLFERDRALPAEALSLHLWAHLWQDFERRDKSTFSREQLTPNYVTHAITTYSRLARPFLPPGLASTSLAYAFERLRWRLALSRGQKLRNRIGALLREARR